MNFVFGLRVRVLLNAVRWVVVDCVDRCPMSLFLHGCVVASMLKVRRGCLALRLCGDDYFEFVWDWFT